MLRFFRRPKRETLESKLHDVDARLALTKVQLAAQMVKLAGQTDDITPLKQAEEALKESRDLFDSFMRHLPALAFIKDRKGRYIYTNQAYCTLFDEPQGYRLGKTDMALWDEEGALELMANDRLALKQNRILNAVEKTQYEGETQYWQVIMNDVSLRRHGYINTTGIIICPIRQATLIISHMLLEITLMALLLTRVSL